MIYLLFTLGLLLLLGGAELLVRGASALAARLGITPLVIGLTVVAFGTSAPELSVSAVAGLRGDPNLALGNVVGSNIFNVLGVLGISALIAPLVVSREVVRRQVPLMIGVSLLVVLLAADGRIGRGEGAFLLVGIVAYTGFLLRDARRIGATVGPMGPTVDGEGSGSGGAAALAGPGRKGSAGPLLHVVMAAAGLLFLVLGSRWLVEAAREMALRAGVSELVVGLTVVAVGTSLPELATSLVAVVRGHRDVAVGNVVGSNVFNLLAILGTGAVLAPEGIEAAPAALTFDLPVMVAVAVACLPVFFTGSRISRWEGGLFTAYYVAYLAYLALDTTGHQALPEFRAAMVFFVLPLTTVTGLVLLAGALRKGG